MSQETMKLALEALLLSDTVFYSQTKIAIAAIEEALANHCEDNLNMVKQEQGEPVAWMTETGSVWKTREKNTDLPLYTHPQPKSKSEKQ
jgi:hypothetical protein